MEKMIKNKDDKPRFGCQLTVAKQYFSFKRDYQSLDNNCWKENKVWEISSIKPTNVIFLGYRNIKEGVVSGDATSGGFIVKKQIRVMYVCAENRNPIYVPLGEYSEF